MAAGAATERIRLGTGVCLVVERDPIVTAKAAASVDRLTGGRLLFGVGAGWNLEEMRNHGTDPARRFAIMRERVEAIKEIWTSDEATYHGEHVDFDRIWCWPKPLTEPHPPIIVGGHGKRVLDRVLAFGDEWMPNRIGDDAADQRPDRPAAQGRARTPAAGRSRPRSPTRPPTPRCSSCTSGRRAPGAVLGRARATSPTSSAGSTGSRPGSRPTSGAAERRAQSCEASNSSPAASAR